MSDEELEIYDQIMNGGYGIINTGKIMISGNIEMLKNILQVSHQIQKQEQDDEPDM